MLHDDSMGQRASTILGYFWARLLKKLSRCKERSSLELELLDEKLPAFFLRLECFFG